MKPFYVLSFLLLWYIPSNVLAEGTKELAPNPTDVAFLHFWRANQLEFAAYDGAPENRINIRIGNPGNEIIYLGFNEKLFDPLDTIPTYFRIKDPNGNVVYGPIKIPKSGVGYITNHAQAVAGPNVLAAGGYPALSFTPSTSGDYYIEFNRGDSTIQQQDEFYLEYFDITVANAPTNTAILGRVCSKNWQISTNALTQPFNGSFHVYSTDSIVTKLNLNGVKPFKFNIYCNSFGVIDTTDLFFARASDAIRVLNPEYCLFLNDPDHNEFPTGVPARITGDPPNLTCESGQLYINATFTKAGVAEILINLNGIPGFQPNSEDVRIGRRSNQVVAGLNKFPWDGLDGLGNTVNYNVNIEIKTTIQSGYTNFPIFDPEENPNGFDVDLIRPTGTKPLLYWDDSTHLANIGGTIETNGCTNNCHQWFTTTFGDGKTLNTFWAGIADTISFNTLFRGCMPVAVNDTIPCFSEDSLSQLVITPFTNDSDPDDNLDTTSTRIIVGSSLGNTTSVNSQGQVLYDLPPHFNGNDSLIYEICDETNLCDTATVYICVSAVADPPIAVKDSLCIGHNQSMTYDILNNDSDVDGTLNNNSTTLINIPQNGTVSISGGIITYVPNTDYIGQDTITYQVADNEGNLSNIAEILITVDHTIPNAINDTVSTLMNNSVLGNVLTNDSDNDNSPFILSTTPILAPTNGQVTLLANGDFEYIPNTNFSGIDSFHYELLTLSICDGTVSLSTKGTVIIDVLDACLTGCQSVAPTAVTDSLTIIDGILASINVLNNDFDNNADSIYVQSVVSNFTKGFGGINLANGDLTYSPAGGMTGFDTLTYRVCDTTGRCTIGSVIIEILPFSNGNKIPIANVDNFTTTLNNAISFNVLANDADQDPFFNTLSITILQAPTNGNLSGINTTTGALTYTPNANFTGIDNFTYQVCDNGTPTLCDVATANVHVIDCSIAPNQPPIARNDTTNTPLNTIKTISILANDTDADGTIDVSFTQINNPPKNGVLTIDANTGNVVYTPNTDFIGLDSFTYLIRDNANCYAQAKVLINVSFEVTATNSSPVCTGSADVQLMASSSVSGATFKWYNSNNQEIGTGNPLLIPSTLANAGDYYTIGTIGTIASSRSNITTVQIDTASTAQAGLNNAICNDEIKDTLNAVIPPIGTGSWSSNDPNLLIQDVTDPNTALNNITLPTTKLYWTVENGVCRNTDSLTITKNPSLTPPTLSDTAFCTGDSVTLTAITNYSNATFNWTGSNGFTSNLPNPTITNAGIYTVTMKVGECTATPVSSTVTIHPLSAAPVLVSNEPCYGENLVLTIPSPSASSQYRWIAPNGIDTISNTNSISIVTNDFKYQEGIWQAQYLDANGCWSAIQSTNTIIKSKPTTPVAWSTPICENETVQLFTNTVPNATYHWTGSNSSNLQNPSFTGTLQNAGLYQLQTEVNSCLSDPTFVTAVINPLPDINLLQVGSCQGDTILLQTDALQGATFSWSFGGSVILQGVDENILTIDNAQPSDQGTYTLIVNTTANCSDTAITTLNLLSQPPTPTIIGDTICRGEDLEISTSAGGNLFEWLLPDNTILTTTASHLIIKSDSIHYQTGQWKVRIKNNSGTCISDYSAPTNVLIKDLPASVTPTASDVCEGETIQLAAQPGFTYNWTGPNGFSNTSTNTPTITNATTIHSGLYELEVTVDGCTSSKSGVNITVHPNPTPLPSFSTTCEGSTLTLNDNGSNPVGSTYLWRRISNNNTNTSAVWAIPNATTSLNGIFELTVTTPTGCVGIDSINVVIDPKPITPTIHTLDNSLCVGESFNITIQENYGNTATYQWLKDGNTINNPFPIAAVTINDAGNYSVQVTDNGCTSNLSNVIALTVDDIIAPNPTATYSDPNFCSGGTLTLSANGIANTSYQWSGPNGFSTNKSDTSFIATNLNSGNYQITVTNGACVITDFITVTIKDTIVTPTIHTLDNSLCVGESFNITIQENYGNNATYQWFKDGNAINNPFPISTVTVNDAGNYSVQVTDNGCTSNLSNVITLTVDDIIAPNPTATYSDPNFCSGGTLTLSANGVTNTAYQWSGPNGFSTNKSDTSFIATNLNNGNYQITVTNGACIDTGSVLVNFVKDSLTHPIISITGDSCQNGNVTLSTTTYNGTTISYVWNQSNGQSNTTNIPNLALSNTTAVDSGYYDVTVLVDGCSTKSDSVLLSIYPNPTNFSASASTPICEGNELFLNANNTNSLNTQFEWSNGLMPINGDTSMLNVSVSDAGLYTLTVTNIYGCTNEDTVSVVVAPRPATPMVNDATLCEQEDLTLTTNTYNGNTVFYYWTFANGTVVDTTTTAMNTINTIGTSYSGASSISVNVDGCNSLVSNFNLMVNPIPIATATNSTVVGAACEGETIQFNTPSVGNYNWFGITGTGTLNPFIQNPTIDNATISDTGIYALIVEQNGCFSDTAFTTVNINATPITPNLPHVAYCEGSDIALPSPPPGVNYTFLAPTNLPVVNDSLINISPSDAGSYILIPDIGGCEGTPDTFLIDVDIIGNPAFAGLDDSLCLDELIALNAIADSTVQGSWLAVNNTNIEVIPPNNPNALAVGFQEGNNQLVWVVSNGACIAYDNDTVNIFLHHTPNAEDDLIQDSLGRTLNFSVIDNDDLNNMNWSIQNQSNPQFGQLTNNGDGTFIYQPTRLEKEDKFTYKVWNEDCPMLSDIAEVTINVDGHIFPTIITPNGDGANDVLVFTCPVNRRSIQIFNRYGSEVYKSNDYKNDWRGEWSDGNPLPDGTYFYIVTEDGNTLPPVYITIVRKRQ